MHLHQACCPACLPQALQGGTAETDLLLVFGSVHALKDPEWEKTLKESARHATVVGASTDCTISNDNCGCDLVWTHIRFRTSHLHWAMEPIPTPEDSEKAGAQLAKALSPFNPHYVFLLSDGLFVNGSALVRGVQQGLGADVLVTGGLANDGARFQETFILANGEVHTKHAVAVGFSGKNLQVSSAAIGGWKPFGPVRQVTRAEGNTVYEFDGEPALPLYERYLGEEAKDLPASGLLYPIELTTPSGEGIGLARTLLQIDRQNHALIFAGEVPQGSFARLMHARFDDLISGAGSSAMEASSTHSEPPDLAILISCIGRKFLLGTRVQREVDAVRQVLGPKPLLCGFYSNGEISPYTPTARCELHNQTMTLTLLWESPCK